MLILIAIILGVVEGLTEFLPVSSTGHLILAGHALDFTGPKAAIFEVFIQLGAILAVVWLYRQRFVSLLRPGRKGNDDGASNDNDDNDSGNPQGLRGRHGLLLLGLTTLPALLAGFMAHGFIKEHLFQPLTVAIGLFVGGVIILTFESRPHHYTTRSLDTLSRRQALQIGLAQIIAMWPGVSRSGATIIGGVLSGLDRKTAVEYSFLAAVPVMIAATSYDLLKGITAGTLQAADWPLFATGFVTAFVSAVLAIKYFVRFVQAHDFKPFAWYRIGLAVLVVLVLV